MRNRDVIYLFCVLLLIPVLSYASPSSQYFEEQNGSTLSEANKRILDVYFKELPLGKVEAYESIYGLKLPLGALAHLLGFPISIDPKQGGAEGSLVTENEIFFLNNSLHLFIVNGKTNNYLADLVTASDTDIFVDITILGFMLPVRFNFDGSQDKLSVSPRSSLPAIDQNKLATRWSQLIPQNTIASPLYSTEIAPSREVEMKEKILPRKEKSQLVTPKKAAVNSPTPSLPETANPPSPTDQKNPTEKTKKEPVIEEEVVPISPAPLSPLPSPVPVTPPLMENKEAEEEHTTSTLPDTEQPVEEQKLPTSPELLEENLLVLQASLEDITFPDFIEAFQIGKESYLPLGTLTQLLQLAITVDPTHGRASGWFIKTDRTFALDTTKKTVLIKGKSHPIPEGKVLTNDSDIFVESTLLSTWLGIHFKVNASLLALTIQSKELLPLQLKQQRDKNWAKGKASVKKEKNYPLLDVPYQKATVPFVDISLSNNFSTEKNSPSHSGDFSLRAGGDLAYLNTQTFISGSTEGLRTIRFSGNRKENGSSLLGPLQATAFTLGDVDTYSIPLIAQTGQGRGVTVTNRPLSTPTQFDMTEFVGTDLPGWDVELYRNGALLGFQQIASDGRYQFTNIPVLYGNNTFRLVFYGPQGQIREEVKHMVAADSVLKKGTSHYVVSADQKAETLLGIDENAQCGEGLRFLSTVDYGITNHVTGHLGMMQIPLEDGLHHYLSTGFVSSLPGGVLASTDIAQEMSEQKFAGKISVLGSLFGISLKGEHRHYQDGFLSEEQDIHIGLVKSKTEFDANTSLPFFPNITTGTSLEREIYQSGAVQTTINNRLSGSLLGTVLTNNIGATEIKIDDKKTRSIIGGLAINTMIKSIAFRAAANYTLPDQQLTNFTLSAQKRLKDNLIAAVGMTKDLSTNNKSTLSGSINWDIDYAKLSIRADADSDHTFRIGTNVSFSLGQDPRNGKWHIQSKAMADFGAISAAAFIDKNYNGTFDHQDEWIDEIGVKIGNRMVKSDATGILFNSGFPNNIRTNIVFDESTLKDPLWLVEKPQLSLLSRPGAVTQIDFPVIATSEIDGVILLQKEGQEQPLSGIEVQLIDAKGEVVQKTRSEFDGFFVIEKIKPGTYTVQISPTILEMRQLTANVLNITTTGESNIYSEQKIILQPLTHAEEENTLTTADEEKPAESKPLPSAVATYLQLGAFRTKEAAEKAAATIYQHHATIIGETALSIEEKHHPTNQVILFKVVLHPATEEDKKRLCKDLIEHQQACIIAKS